MYRGRDHRAGGLRIKDFWDDGEPVDVPDSGFLNSSLTGIGGLHLKSLRCLFGERQIERMRVNRVMINSGALLGSGTAFTSFMSGYVDTLWGVRDRDCRFQERGYRDRARLIKKRTGRIVPPSYWWWIPDQLVLNVVARRRDRWLEGTVGGKRAEDGASPPPVQFASNEASILLNVGGGEQLEHPEAVPPFGLRMAEGARDVVGLVHQWDRSPALQAAIVSGSWGGLRETDEGP